MSAKLFSVYAHKAPNNKLYFGITSLKPKHRWYSDGRGYKNQPLFYRAIQKYGWDNFEHYIIAKELSQEQAHQMEKDLIMMFQSNNPKFGYNNTKGGEGITGYQHTEKAKKKLSRYAKKHNTQLYCQRVSYSNRKKCALIDKNNRIIYKFNSISECATQLDLSPACISRKLKTNGNYGYLKFVEVK